MGTLVENKGLNIKFEVNDIVQSELEQHENALNAYLADNKTEDDEKILNAVLMSAIVFGANCAGWIPDGIIDDIKKEKPAKISFLALQIVEIINSTKSEEVEDFEIREINQGDLEVYERLRNKYVKSMNLSFLEIALQNRIMAEIASEIGWVNIDFDILSSKPAVIAKIANNVTDALIDARTIPGE